MTGLSKCGPSMIDYDNLRSKNHWYMERLEKGLSYNRDNIMLLYKIHSSNMMWERTRFVFERLTEQFSKIGSVAIVNCSNSIPWCNFFKEKYQSNITLISDHPSFEATSSFYNEAFKTTNVFDSIFFNDLSTTLRQHDLVVFPEFEYLVPLDLLKNYNDIKNTAVIHHMHHINDSNTRELVLSIEDLLDQCNFINVIYSDRFKNVDNRYVYFALGSR